MISVIIKGPALNAIVAAMDHDIELTDLRQVKGFGDLIVGYTTVDNHTKLIKWYGETVETPPFPHGTLMLFSVHPEVHAKNA